MVKILRCIEQPFGFDSRTGYQCRYSLMSPEIFHWSSKFVKRNLCTVLYEACRNAHFLDRMRSRFKTSFLFHLLNNFTRHQAMLESYSGLHHHNPLKFTTTANSINKNKSTSFKELFTHRSLLHNNILCRVSKLNAYKIFIIFLHWLDIEVHY